MLLFKQRDKMTHSFFGCPNPLCNSGSTSINHNAGGGSSTWVKPALSLLSLSPPGFQGGVLSVDLQTQVHWTTCFTKRRKLAGNARTSWIADRTREPREPQHPMQIFVWVLWVQKAQEEGGDQAQLRPNLLPRCLCPNKSFLY